MPTLGSIVVNGKFSAAAPAPVRGVPGIVRHGETGLLVAESDDFSAALGRLIDDTELRHRFGAAAAVTIAADHSLDGAATTLNRALSVAAS